MKTTPNIRAQADYNAGRTGGVLVSLIKEPLNAPGNWEMFKSFRTEIPDPLSRITTWVPRSVASEEACKLYDRH